MASQSRIPVEHRQVRIRTSEEGQPACGWAYFTHPARITTALSARMQVGICRYFVAIHLRLLCNRQSRAVIVKNRYGIAIKPDFPTGFLSLSTAQNQYFPCAFLALEKNQVGRQGKSQATAPQVSMNHARFRRCLIANGFQNMHQRGVVRSW